MSAVNDNFLRLLSGPSPELRVKFRKTDLESKIIRVQHRLGSKPMIESYEFLDSLGKHNWLNTFCEFYQQHDGVENCRTFDARHWEDRPLFEFISATNIRTFTGRYLPGGDLDWTMDLNKSKALYRSSASW